MRTWLPPSLTPLGLLITAGVAAACGSTVDGREGSSCPNSNNCIFPLQCIDGTCQMAVAQRDGGVPRDGGVAPRDAGPRDGGEPVYMDQFNAGTLTITPDGTTAGFDQLAGTAAMIREATGYTSARLEVTGLTPSTQFNAHVHALPCDMEGGGGHYKIDDTVMEVVQANEIWLTFTTDANGVGGVTTRVSHYAREDARSVVIHAPGAPERIACANLAPNADLTASGTFVELPDGMGSGITGTAELRRYAQRTTATVTIMGTLETNTIYPTHVHARRCDDMAGGGHYKIDDAVQDTVQENEIWPNPASDATGAMATGQAGVDHVARFDAYAVVVHDPVTNNRLLCADLRW